MAHAENETTISRSPEDVHAYLADGLNNKAWRSGIQAIALKTGAAGALGAVYSQTPRSRVGGPERVAARPQARGVALSGLVAKPPGWGPEVIGQPG